MAKATVRKRISTIQIGRAFDTLSGSSEDRLQKLMGDTGFPAEKLIKTLAVYKARVWSQREFPSFQGAGDGRQPPKDKEVVLAALNKSGSIVQAAKTLKTTPITLTKWVGYFKLKQTIEYGEEKKVSWR